MAATNRSKENHPSRWPNRAKALYTTEKSVRSGRYLQAAEEVDRHFGYGFLDGEPMCEAPLHGVTLVGLGRVRRDRGTIFDMPLPPSVSGDRVYRSMRVTVTWFSPVDPARARYRLATLEAIAADGDEFKDHPKDKHWSLAMKTEFLAEALIKRGTVWSRRLVHMRVRAPDNDNGATIPI